MVRYELIKNISNLTELIGAGILPISISVKKQVYETYLNELKTNDKQTAIQFTADYYSFSISQIYKIIAFMES